MDRETMTFDGETYDPERDRVRLTNQLNAVYALMYDQHWRTLYQISYIVGGSEAGVSARLRDLRKERNGAHIVERRHVQNGLHEYRLIPRLPDAKV